MNARANYIISAQDATKDAIRSIQNNFKSLDQGIKSTARNMNLALGFLAGAGLKGLFRNSLEATAEAAGKNSDFARTLDDVKKSATSLLVPKQGLSGVTDNLKELAATLKDPAVVSAADALFSAILKGGTAAVNVLAQTAAGLRILVTNAGGNSSVDIDNKILALKDQMRGFDSDPRNSVARRERARIQQDINELQRKYDTSLRGDAGEGLQAVDGTGAMNSLIGGLQEYADKAAAAYEANQEFLKSLEDLPDASKKVREQLDASAKDSIDALPQAFEAAEAQRKLTEDAEKALADQERRTSEWRERMTEENKRAARDSQEAWKGLFLDVMDDGFKGLLRGWKRMLKEMAAEGLASGVLNWLKGGSFSAGFSSGTDNFVSGVGKLFGFANGGSILPSGGGGADTQTVAFRKSPRERVDIYTPGRQGGGVVVAPVYNIDARGATTDLVRALPVILKKNNEALRADILMGLSRGKYAV